MSKREITIYNHINHTEEVFNPEIFETTIFSRVFNSSIYRSLIENRYAPVCKVKKDYFCFTNFQKNHFRMSFDINISDKHGIFIAQGFKGYSINVLADFDPAIVVTIDYIDSVNFSTITPPKDLNTKLNKVIVSLILVYLYDIDRLEKIAPQDITFFCTINNEKRLLAQEDINANKFVQLSYLGDSSGIIMDPYDLLHEIIKYRAGIYVLSPLKIYFKLEGYDILKQTFLISYGGVNCILDNRADYCPEVTISFKKDDQKCLVVVSATEDTDIVNFNYKAAYNLAISMAARLFIERSWQPIIEQLGLSAEKTLNPEEIIYQNRMTKFVELYTLKNIEENRYIKIGGTEIDTPTDDLITCLSKHEECLLQTSQVNIRFQTITWNNDIFRFKVSVVNKSHCIPFAVYSIQKGNIKLNNLRGKYLSTIEKYYLDLRASLVLDSIGNILMSMTIAWIKHINTSKNDFSWINNYVAQKGEDN